VLLVRKHGVVPPFELEGRLKAARMGADDRAES
jgi:hypothetical protein